MFPSKYVFHRSFLEENMNRERQLQWIQEIKLRYSDFNANTVDRWKADVSQALCLKPGPEMPGIDWAKLEFGECSVSSFKKELLLRTGFRYETEQMDLSAYQEAWSDYLMSLREETKKKLARSRKLSPVSVYDYSRKSMGHAYNMNRNRVFFGDPPPRTYFWK
mmetsp:Transcript_11359/g.28790  ORF Transcript_11359/g.28790 Transcript_11359/m.28790 type:complete len:163 (+) Transcript_11359:2420-2908(+)